MESKINEIIAVAEATISKYREENARLHQKIAQLSESQEANKNFAAASAPARWGFWGQAPQKNPWEAAVQKMQGENAEAEPVNTGEAVLKSEYESMKQHYIEELRRTSAALRAKEDEVQSHLQKVKDAENEVESLKSQLASNIDKLNELREAEKEYQKTIEELKDSLKNTGTSTSSIMNSGLYKDLELMLAKEKENSKQLEVRIKALESDQKTLDVAKTVVERQLENVQKKLDAANEKLNKKAAPAPVDVSQYTDQIKAKDAELKKLKKEYSKLQKSFDDLQEKYQRLLRESNEDSSDAARDASGEEEAEVLTITADDFRLLKKELNLELNAKRASLIALSVKKDGAMKNPDNIVYKMRGRKKGRPSLTKSAKKEVAEIQREIDETKAYCCKLDEALKSVELAAKGEAEINEFTYNILCDLKKRLASGELKSSDNMDEADDELNKSLWKEMADSLNKTDNGTESSEATAEQSAAANESSEETEEDISEDAVESESESENASAKGTEANSDADVKEGASSDEAVEDTVKVFFNAEQRDFVTDTAIDFLATPENILVAKYGSAKDSSLTQYGVSTMIAVIKFITNSVNAVLDRVFGCNSEDTGTLTSYFDAARMALEEGMGLEGFNIVYFIGRAMEDAGIMKEALFTEVGINVSGTISEDTAETIKKDIPGIALFANPLEQSLAFYHKEI